MAGYSLLRVILVIWLTKAPAVASAQEEQCQFICGDISIPCPFGIGEGCYGNKNFAVTCNDSTNTPTPFITSIGRQLLDSSLTGYIQANNPVISSYPNSTISVNITGDDLSDTPFEYLSIHNRFIAMGCDNYATLDDRYGSTIGECLSICGKTRSSGSYGLDCCQATIPPGLKTFVQT